MEPNHWELLKWLLGTMGGICIFGFGIWWRIVAKQDKKLDTFAEHNGTEHKIIHSKIDRVQDKVEDIWKHLVKAK